MWNAIELTEIKLNINTAKIEYQKIVIYLQNVTCFYEECVSSLFCHLKNKECTCVYIGERDILINEKFETLLNAVEKNGKLSEWVEFETDKGQRIFIRRKDIIKVGQQDGKTFVTLSNWRSVDIDETLEYAKKKLESEE